MDSTPRTKIVNAAIDLFSARGFHETSMRDIAAAVGLRVSSLYSHFSGKDQILHTILDLYKQEIERIRIPEERLQQLVETFTPVEILTQGLMVIGEMATSERMEKILLIIYSEVYRNPDVRSFSLEWVRGENLRNVRRIFEVMQEKGDVAITELPGPLRAMVDPLKPGQAIAAVQVDAGTVMTLMVCERKEPEPTPLPGREDIRERITQQRLDLMARRYLRDIRRAAFVDLRV